MNRVLTFTLLLLVFLGCSHTENSGDTNSDKHLTDDYSAKIDRLLQTTSPRKFNGVVLIHQDGKEKYSNAFGYSNFETNTPITLQDNFRIQSNSKQVTAVLILKEVEKGTIDLGKTIRDYLADFDRTWADSVTIHQLLNMSSGIVSLKKGLIFEPGTDYKYSNAAYGLLGRILEKVSGTKYIELANSLFQELAMSNTFCYEFGAHQPSLINGYVNTGDGYELVDFYSRGITPEGWLDFIPAGGIISNATDLTIWDAKLHHGKILKPESYELMTSFTIRGQHAAFGEEEIGYGYGVRIDDSKALKIIGHAGKGIGFANIKFYVPEKDLHVVLLENVYDEDPNVVYHFEREIIDLVMNSNLVR